MNYRLHIAISIIILSLFTGCAMISDPEKTGGEIITVPQGLWCEFNISRVGKWLQLLGDSSPWFDSSKTDKPTHQRQSQFVDHETGDLHTPEPKPDVIEHIKKGFGAKWTGCFNPDTRTVYYSKSVWSDLTSPQSGTETNEAGQQQPRTAMALPSQGQVERYYYAVDLTEKPLMLKQVSSMNYAAPDEPKEPPITVRQVSDKRIQIYSDLGDLLVTHKPRGLLSSRIHMADRLGSQRWGDQNTLSPDGTWLAYIVGESGIMFTSPTQGHVMHLSPDADPSSKFLAASVYTFKWSSNGDLFACTSHSQHRTAIVRGFQ